MASKTKLVLRFALVLGLALSGARAQDMVGPTATVEAKKAKPKRRAAVRRAPAPLIAPEASPLLSRDVPAVGARSVMIIDAHTGDVLYEKNADELRPPASTQKLLTALIIAERGYLDQMVRVGAIDTMCEPVKLNVRPGDTYQRLELLRALLVKSPNDVARCLGRDYAGSIGAFCRSDEPARSGARRDPPAFCQPKRFARAWSIFQRARFVGHRPRGLREPDHPVDCLHAADRFSLRQWPDARVGKHEQGPAALTLL